jgi:RNA polymerase sigma-70 factor (ECF subfamily)
LLLVEHLGTAAAHAPHRAAFGAWEAGMGSTRRPIRHSGFFATSRTPINDRMMSDEELVAEMIANEPHAWREFQRRYDRLIHASINKVIRRFARVVVKEDSREIYATLLVSLLSNDKHKLRTFDPERGNRFSSWIGLLAINCAYDYLRALRREPNKGTLAEAADVVGKDPDPYEQALEREQAKIASRALSGFSAKDRTFATLYFGEGMEPSDVARAMKISVKTVYSKRHKIQSRLESVLGSAVQFSANDDLAA